MNLTPVQNRTNHLAEKLRKLNADKAKTILAILKTETSGAGGWCSEEKRAHVKF